MEEAVTRKFVHEDSSHIISFCGKMDQSRPFLSLSVCLSPGRWAYLSSWCWLRQAGKQAPCRQMIGFSEFDLKVNSSLSVAESVPGTRGTKESARKETYLFDLHSTFREHPRQLAGFKNKS